MNASRKQARLRLGAQGGFTLIELLVVISVLAILASIVVLNISGFANHGQTAACQTDLKTVQVASDVYLSDHPGTDPTTLELDLLVPRYIHTSPTDLGTVTWSSSGTVASSKC